eukprot:758396-Hanusia_phi.AAC.1
MYLIAIRCVSTYSTVAVREGKCTPTMLKSRKVAAITKIDEESSHVIHPSIYPSYPGIHSFIHAFTHSLTVGVTHSLSLTQSNSACGRTDENHARLR